MTIKDKQKVDNIKIMINDEIHELDMMIKLSKPSADIDSLILQKRCEAQILAYNQSLKLLSML